MNILVLQGPMVNPAGLTQHGVPLHDAIKAMPFAVLKVHMSNIAAREAWRAQPAGCYCTGLSVFQFFIAWLLRSGAALSSRTAVCRSTSHRRLAVVMAEPGCFSLAQRLMSSKCA